MFELELRDIYNTFIPYTKKNDEFKKELKKVDADATYDKFFYYYVNNKNKRKIVKFAENDMNEQFFKTLNTNPLKKLFISLNVSLILLIMKMKKINLKLIKRIDTLKLEQAIEKDNIKEIFREFLNIHKKVNYFISSRYLNSQLFTNEKIIHTRQYYKSKKYDNQMNCFREKCAVTDAQQELNTLFGREKFKLLEIKGNVSKQLKTFIKSQLFKDYYLCVYSNCSKQTIDFFRADITYKFAVFCIKNDCKLFKNYEKKFQKLVSSLHISKIKKETFAKFLAVIRNYWKFFFKLKGNSRAMNIY